MHLKFPLEDVDIEISTQKKQVSSALYDDGYYRLNETEFCMDVENVGWFYAERGKYINLVLYPEATKASVELYLNGSTYGAILHQRKLMPIHGSSFVYNAKGIMLCGESGAGKSSLTASFCENGSQFLTDDVSPIKFIEQNPFILPLSDRIKLWQDSLEQLNYPKGELTQIWKDYSKFYLPITSNDVKPFPLDIIFILEKYSGNQVEISEVKAVEKFEALRNEIYRWEYLEGMKNTEASYLKNIIGLINNVKVFKVFRPEAIEISKTTSKLGSFIHKQCNQ